MRLLRNFLAWDSRAASGLQDERNKADMEMSINLTFSALFCHVTWASTGCSNESWAGGGWRDKGDIKVRVEPL